MNMRKLSLLRKVSFVLDPISPLCGPVPIPGVCTVGQLESQEELGQNSEQILSQNIRLRDLRVAPSDRDAGCYNYLGDLILCVLQS